MTFEETPLAGAFLVRRERHGDVRGGFERLWCAREFEAQGLNAGLAQASLSTNSRRATLRGMHFQTAPGEEDKLVTCLAGSFYDVIVDLRRGSGSFGRWYGVQLSAAEPLALYIPKGFAHGFMTLEDDTSILYQISQFHDPALSAGLRWDDPGLAIRWPMAPAVISDRDLAHPAIRLDEV